MKKTISALFLSACIGLSSVYADNALILQTDFSLKDGAVSAMKGVAFSVDSNLKIFDLTHEIPPYNIWEGAYRLYQTASYWPKGSVFVSVVDPGVGTNRKSVVLKTKNGQYFVSPDNGTLTLVAQTLGIDSVREIDEKTNRLKGSEKSYTFHGRDV
ncbi:SAM-dependent chlorinase/fluorinase, partial [Helicobacter pylori]